MPEPRDSRARVFGRVVLAELVALAVFAQTTVVAYHACSARPYIAAMAGLALGALVGGVAYPARAATVGLVLGLFVIIPVRIYWDILTVPNLTLITFVQGTLWTYIVPMALSVGLAALAGRILQRVSKRQKV